jgi:hypothetical protein
LHANYTPCSGHGGLTSCRNWVSTRLPDALGRVGSTLVAGSRKILREAVDLGGDVVTAGSADYSGLQGRSVVSVDELFQGSAPVRSAADLAEDGVFDDGELEEFLADLAAMRRADLA